MAAEHGSWECVEVLIQRGADLHATSQVHANALRVGYLYSQLKLLNGSTRIYPFLCIHVLYLVIQYSRSERTRIAVPSRSSW